MASYKCKVCGYIYDEEKEGTLWRDLPDSWCCPLCSSDKSYFTTSQVYECSVCAYVYDEAKETAAWSELDEKWECPVCSSDKSYFSLKNKAEVLDEKVSSEVEVEAGKNRYLAEWLRSEDSQEEHFSNIHEIAEKGNHIIEPMKSRIADSYWSDLLFKGGQLARPPLNNDEAVKTEVVIGRNAKQPLIISAPIIVSHMSFGALSREAKTALARGSATVKTAMCSGEGGILTDSIESSYKYIFEFVPNKYSVTDDFLSRVDAVEIKIGQSAKPGMGGHLPADKVTEEISRIRNKPMGKDIISPSKFSEISSREDLKNVVYELRERISGKPVGVKIAAGHIEEDLEFILVCKTGFYND